MSETLFGLVFLAMALWAVAAHIKWKRGQESAGSGLVCLNCSTVERARRRTKGSGGVEILMWFFFLLPGLIYSVWRRSGKTEWFECHVCGSTDLIPLDSQRAHALLAQENHIEREGIRNECECPHCAELILKKARVCKHCGRSMTGLSTT